MIKSMYSPCFTCFHLLWREKYPDLPLKVEKGSSLDYVSVILDGYSPEQIAEIEILIDFFNHGWRASYNWYTAMVKQYIEIEYTKEIVLLADGK